MNNFDWKDNDPFMPDLKTADDYRNYIKAGGLALVESRIENVFSVKLCLLKEKISRLVSVEEGDPFLANVLWTSILVDTRAFFLESGRHPRNATLQNVYRARKREDLAEAIDKKFDVKVIEDESIRDIIKSWVDKRVVHMDWLWDDREVLITKQMEDLIYGNGMKSLREVLLEIIEEYDEFVVEFGKNTREQIDLFLEATTGT